VSDEQFYKKTQAMPSGCIEYIGAKNSSGYGWVRRLGTQMAASRYAWIAAYGTVPMGMHVLHTCDNRACVNIKHLYLGTHSDNMRDRRDRHRVRTQKLTANDAHEIRKKYTEGLKIKELSQEFSLSYSYVHSLVRGEYWL